MYIHLSVIPSAIPLRLDAIHLLRASATEFCFHGFIPPKNIASIHHTVQQRVKCPPYAGTIPLLRSLS